MLDDFNGLGLGASVWDSDLGVLCGSPSVYPSTIIPFSDHAGISKPMVTNGTFSNVAFDEEPWIQTSDQHAGWQITTEPSADSKEEPCRTVCPDDIMLKQKVMLLGGPMLTEDVFYDRAEAAFLARVNSHYGVAFGNGEARPLKRSRAVLDAPMTRAKPFEETHSRIIIPLPPRMPVEVPGLPYLAPKEAFHFPTSPTSDTEDYKPRAKKQRKSRQSAHSKKTHLSLVLEDMPYTLEDIVFARGLYHCPFPSCSATASSEGDLGRHLESTKHATHTYMYLSPECFGQYVRTDALDRHLKNQTAEHRRMHRQLVEEEGFSTRVHRRDADIVKQRVVANIRERCLQARPSTSGFF